MATTSADAACDSTDEAASGEPELVIEGKSSAARPAAAGKDRVDGKDQPHAVQIVSIIERGSGSDGDGDGEEEQRKKGEDDDVDDDDVGSGGNNYAFRFERERLLRIMDRIPKHYKISVISVVGAFRTGKSFLLSWFLRYLHHCARGGNEVESMGASAAAGGGGVGKGGDEEEPWYNSFKSIGNDGFDWRAGSERNTTGIWMWSHPFLMKPKSRDEDPIAVLLVDTQGMFDHDTTMKLTASIFGFSTLLSSYQIYNVDKRIQEDNLQQLALFSEYARAAVDSDSKGREKQRGGGGGGGGKGDGEDDSDGGKKTGGDRSERDMPKQPFQHIEFLVRDWQHFDHDEEDDEDEDRVDYAALQSSMEAYLDKVLSEREAKDLKETREQIFSCFSEVTCYGLCHPGFAVTKKKYAGDVSGIEPLFLHLLDRYCRKVFSPESLRPKVIHGRELTGAELFAYIEAYAQLFACGTKFPTAATMLEATAAANNTNAVNLALTQYKEIMDRVAGPRCSNYIKPELLREEHSMAMVHCMEVFDSIANFGNQTSITEARMKVERESDKNFSMYNALNDGRNPLSGLETYVLSLLVRRAAEPRLDFILFYFI